MEYLACSEGISRLEFGRLARSIVRNYAAKHIHPGTNVGAIAAQSIGEPGFDRGRSFLALIISI